MTTDPTTAILEKITAILERQNAALERIADALVLVDAEQSRRKGETTMANLKNLRNGYELELGKLFDEMPKSVVAAIAVSALTMGGDFLEEAKQRAAREWQALYDAGIVPQRPGKVARQINAEHAEKA